MGIKENRVIIRLSGEPQENPRALVVDGGHIANQFRLADAASGLFLYNDTLLYMIENNPIVKVNIERRNFNRM